MDKEPTVWLHQKGNESQYKVDLDSIWKLVPSANGVHISVGKWDARPQILA